MLLSFVFYFQPQYEEFRSFGLSSFTFFRMQLHFRILLYIKKNFPGQVPNFKQRVLMENKLEAKGALPFLSKSIFFLLISTLIRNTGTE